MAKEQALVAMPDTQILCNEESVPSVACNFWFYDQSIWNRAP